MARLTMDGVKKLRPKKTRYDVQDDEIKKLRLVIHPSGLKSWTVAYSENGDRRRPKIAVCMEPGNPTVITGPKTARIEAAALLVRLGSQGGIAQEKALIENIPRLKDWFDKFLEINPRDWTDKTTESMVGRFTLYVGPIFGKTRLHKITEANLEAFAKKVKDGKDLPVIKTDKGERQGKGGARTADKAVELILTLLSWANKPHQKFPKDWRLPDYSRHYIGTEKEENYIYLSEAAAFGAAVDALRDRPSYRQTDNLATADAILFALFTGARYSNILSAEWSEIDFAANVWRIPRAKFKSRKKTNKGHTVPLIPQAVAILQGIRDRQESKGVSTLFIFPYPPDPSRPTGDIGKSWDFVRERAGIQRVNFHGLRHTLASWQGQSGVNQKMIAASLGQADPTSANFYVHSDLEVVRGNMAGAIDAAFTVVEEPPQETDKVLGGLSKEEQELILKLRRKRSSEPQGQTDNLKRLT